MKIPIKECINSGAWYHFNTKAYLESADTEQSDVDFRLKIFAFEKINLKKIDNPNKISLDLSSGVLWILRAQVVNLTKKTIGSFPVSEAVVLVDQDNYEFKPTSDGQLTMRAYGKANGLNILNGWGGGYSEDCGILIPKIPIKGAFAFFLPKDEEAEYYLSNKNGEIREV